MATNSAMSGEGHASDFQHDECERAADHADHQVPGNVTGDRSGAVGADGTDPQGGRRREQVDGPVHHLRSFQDHQVGEDEHGQGPGDSGRDPTQHASHGRGQPGGKRPDSFLVVLHVLQGVGALQQVTDRSPAGACLLDQIRQLSREAASFLCHRDGERCDDTSQGEQDDKEYHKRRQRPPSAAAHSPLHPTHGGG